MATQNPKGTLDAFVSSAKFDVVHLNKIIVLWQMQNALPWCRIEDPLLGAAFLLANPAATLRSSWWARQEAKKIYKAYHDHVIGILKVRFFPTPLIIYTN